MPVVRSAYLSLQMCHSRYEPGLGEAHHTGVRLHNIHSLPVDPFLVLKAVVYRVAAVGELHGVERFLDFGIIGPGLLPEAMHGILDPYQAHFFRFGNELHHLLHIPLGVTFLNEPEIRPQGIAQPPNAFDVFVHRHSTYRPMGAGSKLIRCKTGLSQSKRLRNEIIGPYISIVHFSGTGINRYSGRRLSVDREKPVGRFACSLTDDIPKGRIDPGPANHGSAPEHTTGE